MPDGARFSMLEADPMKLTYHDYSSPSPCTKAPRLYVAAAPGAAHQSTGPRTSVVEVEGAAGRPETDLQVASLSIWGTP